MPRLRSGDSLQETAQPSGRSEVAAVGSAVYLTESGQPIDSGPDILQLLSPAEVGLLTREGRQSTYRRGECLFRQGDFHDGIHFIRSGRVRSYYVSPAGREITLAYWPPGHFVGAPQIVGGGEHMWTSVAVEPTVGLWLPGRAMHRLIREAPNIAVAMLEGLVYKSKCYTALLQIMATQSKTTRLAHLLLSLATNNGGELAVVEDFSQEELANMVGATRQAVSTTLDKFERLGLIARYGQRIRILDPGRLKG